MKQEEVQQEIMKLVQFLKESGAQKNGPMISTTFNVGDGQQVLDMEFLFPIDREVDLPNEYRLKPVFYLVNAVYKRHVGNPEKLQDTYNEILAYINEHQLQQITSGYNLNVNDEQTAQGEELIIDVYMGVNPSVL